MISILATGGTIASRQASAGAVVTDAAEALVGRAVVPRGVDVEAVNLLQKNSFNLTMDDLAAIANGVRGQLSRPEVDGVVVTHGTDTLEESAFLVDLVHDDPRPVVFTGAQRSADDPGADGPRNLSEAIVVAANAAARDRGVLVAFHGDVFAARGLYKAQTLAPSPFRSRGSGPVGTVRGDEVRFHSRPVRWEPLPASTDRIELAPVAAVLTYPGCGTAAFDLAVETGARGVVVVGTGAGNPNALLVEAIREATAAGVVVALSTRVADGPTAPLYAGGGASDAVGAGAVMTGMLPFSQARILLALLLDHYAPDEARARLADLCAVDASRPGM